TFFRYIYTNYAHKEVINNEGIPMCLQGYSAGAAAIAYSLKDYGAGSYVDKAMMSAGPPLSDLEQACEVPNAPPVQVWPPGQLGMFYPSPALISHSASSFFAHWFDNLSGIPDCNAGITTTAAQNQAWKKMSIVDGITGEGTFSYPHTALSAWIEGP